MIITTTSTKIIPNAIYTKNAGKIFSNKPIVNARIAIIDIPIPIVLHNFFSSYFSFSSFEAVLYPEMNQLPCQESKIIESTANIAKTIHTIQSEPVAKSANFIYILLLKFHFLNFINKNFDISTSTNMSAFHINMFWNFSAFALLHCKYLSNPQTPFQYK